MSNDPNAAPQMPPNDKQAGSGDEKTMGMLAHLLGIFTGFIGPLVIYLIKKENNGFAATEAKESLNFQITLIFAYIASAILMFVIIGIFTYIATAICHVVFCILGTVKANSGENYRYPFAIRLIN